MTTKPHSNDEVISKLEAYFYLCFSIPEFVQIPPAERLSKKQFLEEYKKVLLAQKDEAIADARREGMQSVSNALRAEYGDFLGTGIRVGRVLHRLGILTPPDQTDTNPTN